MIGVVCGCESVLMLDWNAKVLEDWRGLRGEVEVERC